MLSSENKTRRGFGVEMQFVKISHEIFQNENKLSNDFSAAGCLEMLGAAIEKAFLPIIRLNLKMLL